ncbi:MAG: hypothetical protein COT88_01510 [Candidatus Colwellbacteria bacterium CG10_big_fil_rev_8_21_14_0_10_41_28]|uniref:DDH domain-containing protein n=1 Tax=Candidatus Colwellbacteria bacterium CG10_big_fil_rev_8_21_14_0_10_41_28 TaxID=1974539 RepID=A0A2H0VH93_9BACT|nr:MAG: hypothetical protein COT88_01510 [Candidatus Colwellbacteria bacterium CG10_big_fil_rev_8_21_14_0_10_41_28]
MYTEKSKKLETILRDSKKIVFPQPNKLDADSLASALALKRIFEDMGKEAIVYTSQKIKENLSFVPNIEKVTDQFPTDFDLAILVDAGGLKEADISLNEYRELFEERPFVIIDHHIPEEDNKIPFSDLEIIDPDAPATGQMVFDIAKELGWKIDKEIADMLMTSIMLDTLFLTIPRVKEKDLRSVSELVALGSSIYEIKRNHDRAAGYDLDLIKYKAKLINRIELYRNGTIGIVQITKEEMDKYESRLRPSDLIVYDIQWLKGVEVAATLSDTGELIRCSMRAHVPVAQKAAKHFGGGGHERAAAFVVEDKSLAEVKEELIEVLSNLLEN